MHPFKFSALLFAAGLFFSACGDDSSTTSTSGGTAPLTTAPAPAAAAPATEPQFVKEGELSFMTPDGKRSVFNLDIEIADLEDQRTQGLMYRKKMDEKQGMLFVFQNMEPQAFWMHNTYISLDIIYVNDKFEIVSIAKNCPVLSDKSIPSGKPAQYVVEINGGLSDKYQLQPGTRIVWTDLLTGKEMGRDIFQ